jgi:hypothetical protein
MAKRNKKGELLEDWEEVAEEQNELDERAAKLADRSKGQYQRKKNRIVVEPAYPDERIGTFLRGLVLGALAGGVAMLFKAPRSGAESRAWLRSFLEDIRATTTDVADGLRAATGDRDAWAGDDEGSAWTHPPASAEALTLATPLTPAAEPAITVAAPAAVPPTPPATPPGEATTRAMPAVAASEVETRAMPALSSEAESPSPRPPGETVEPGSTMSERAEETEATPTTNVSHPGEVTPPPPVGPAPEEPASPPDRGARD